MLLILEAGGEFSLWVRRGGVGNALGRSLEAELSRASDGSREGIADDGAKDGDWDIAGDDVEVGG